MEVWELLLYKYGKILKSNSEYLKLLKNLKPKIDDILKNFNINTKSSYKNICSLYGRLLV